MKKLTLQNKKIAILATNGFEESELLEPLKVLQENGAEVDIISLEFGQIRSWKEGNWGGPLNVDKVVAESLAENYDGLMLPGGVMNADKLRADPTAISFIKDFVETGKPVAAICHAPWALIESDAIKNKKVTSWPSLKTDIFNAGGQWVDEEVVVDRGLVTSRKPADLPAFNRKMIEQFSEGVYF